MRRPLLALALWTAVSCAGTEAAPPAEGLCDNLQQACGATCVDLQSDALHCGACGNACAGATTCVEGTCSLGCSAPSALCQGACVDLDTDVNHCGSCGHVCDGGDGSIASCDDGECVYGCAGSLRDCNDDGADGCERDVSSDDDNCGACGAACLGPAHAEGRCESAICGLGACHDDYGNCDANPENGCETSLRTSNLNCGGCNQPCNVGAGLRCVAGACELVRPDVRVCGVSAHDVSDFLPAGVPLNVLASCDADDDTQAMLVPRSGTTSLNAVALDAYVRAGGIVITELGNADEVFTMLFAPVAQGAFQGNCSDNVATVIQHTADDPFWTDNTFVAIALADTGCGWDVSAFPGIVPLAGWSPLTVSLAYRELDDGRLWLVEADWQDENFLQSAQTRQLMGSMMLSR